MAPARMETVEPMLSRDHSCEVLPHVLALSFPLSREIGPGRGTDGSRGGGRIWKISTKYWEKGEKKKLTAGLPSFGLFVRSPSSCGSLIMSQDS